PQHHTTPLKNTLTLTTLTQNNTLYQQLINEPTIANTYRGNHPTHWITPGVPHDNYLAHHLMHTKTIIRD
ncbi:hypothetical protein VR41_15085, partial [Streptomyces sp. NRRL B-1568]